MIQEYDPGEGPERYIYDEHLIKVSGYPKVTRTEELGMREVNLIWDADGNLVGVEILSAFGNELGWFVRGYDAACSDIREWASDTVDEWHGLKVFDAHQTLALKELAREMERRWVR